MTERDFVADTAVKLLTSGRTLAESWTIAKGLAHEIEKRYGFDKSTEVELKEKVENTWRKVVEDFTPEISRPRVGRGQE